MPKRILLADDSAAAKKSVENALGTDDYQLLTVEDGRAAIEQVNAAHPHLVLAHAMLPEVDGYEICRQVKENPATSHIPVLLLTGTFEPFDINRAKESRYDGFVTKPLDGPELKSLVTRCIDNAVYPAMDPVEETEPPVTEAEPEEAADVADFPGETALPDTITRSDAMLDRIFPEDEPLEEIAGEDDAITVTDGEQDIFSILDSDGEPEEENEEVDVAETPGDPVAGTEDGDSGSADEVDRSSPDFGIWDSAGENAAEDSAPETSPAEAGQDGEGEPSELAAEDNDLSWFLRKYEDKMPVAEENTAEPEDQEQPDSDPSTMETIVSMPDDEGAAAAEEPLVEDEPLAESDDTPAADGTVEEIDAVPVLDSAAPPELDDQQLEQLARRVVELLSDSVVRDVAWEAVPEIAERLIRERIKEIEEEAESSN